MKRSTVAIVVSAAPALFGALVWVACETPLSPGYQLTDARILAIQSDPVDLVPDSSVSLQALLYVPPGGPAPTYQWSWCAAVGSSLQCSVDAGQLSQILDQDGSFAVDVNYALGSGARTVFPFPVDPAVLQSACVPVQPDAGADGEAGSAEASDEAGSAEASDEAGEPDFGEGGPPVGLRGLACNSTSWTIYVLLTVGVGSTTLQAVRSLTAYLAPPSSPNTNPSIAGLSPFAVAAPDAGLLANPGEQADGSILEPALGTSADGGIVIAAQVPLAATDLYEVTTFRPTSETDASDGAGALPPCPADAGDASDGGCLPQVYESLTISWYVQGGLLERATTTMPSVRLGTPQDWSSVLDNRWAPPSPQGTTQFILVARDNRGGVGWLRLPAPLPSP